MTKQPELPDGDKLRRRAEQRLRERRADYAGQSADPQRQLAELEVYQMELLMQNEELRETRGQLEVALEGYTELFDFAPIGYFVIDEKGHIRDANQAGAGLLGFGKERLVGRRFGQFVSLPHRESFANFLGMVEESERVASECEIEVGGEGV